MVDNTAALTPEMEQQLQYLLENPQPPINQPPQLSDTEIVEKLVQNVSGSMENRGYFVHIDGVEEEDLKALLEQISTTGTNSFNFNLLDSDTVKVKLTCQEKKKRRRDYRRRYRNRPEVKKRRWERNNKPEVRAKRKLYAARGDVKSRKKQCAKRRRLMLKCILRDNPDLYDTYAGECMTAVKSNLCPRVDELSEEEISTTPQASEE